MSHLQCTPARTPELPCSVEPLAHRGVRPLLHAVLGRWGARGSSPGAEGAREARRCWLPAFPRGMLLLHVQG